MPFSTQNASLAEKTNLPLVMSTWPPPKLVAYSPRSMLATISAGSRSPPSMKVLVMRGIGTWA